MSLFYGWNSEGLSASKHQRHMNVVKRLILFGSLSETKLTPLICDNEAPSILYGCTQVHLHFTMCCYTQVDDEPILHAICAEHNKTCAKIF